MFEWRYTYNMKTIMIWPTGDFDGVEIIKHSEIECGSDWDIVNDIIVETEPIRFTYFTLLDGSLRCETVEEMQTEIDNLLQMTIDRGIPADIMLETLNQE